MSKQVFLLTILAMILSACAYQADFSQQPDFDIKNSLQDGYVKSDRPPVYIRLLEQRESPLLDAKVSVNFPPGTAPLQTALVSALPFQVTVFARDDTVDLQTPIAVRAANMPVRSYLQQLEGATGYQIRLHPDRRVVEIAGVVTETWHLPALAGMGGFSARLGFSANNSGQNDNNTTSDVNSFQRSHEIQTNTHYEDDVWDSMVSHAKCVLNVGRCDSGDGLDSLTERTLAVADKEPSAQNAWLVDNRRLGTVTATGRPVDIARLGEWLGTMAVESLKLIRLDCAILDIALDESDESGVNLAAIFGDDDVVSINHSGTTGADNSNLWTIGTSLSSGRFSMDLFIQNLSKRSSVKIMSRVKLSVTNGATAYLNTGEVFSYISDVNTVVTEGVATTSFNQNRLQVGLELAITPRLVGDDGRIFLEVVPVLSSLVRFDQLGSGPNTTNAPVIALRQMSSQAVTHSGQPITIGGLSWNKLSGDKSGFAEGFKLSDWLSTRRKEFESRQLLIVITPREVTT